MLNLNLLKSDKEIVREQFEYWLNNCWMHQQLLIATNW